MIRHALTSLILPQNWLLLGCSSNYSTWMVLLVLAVQLLVVGQIFRVWVGPFILRKVSKRVSVQRVSLRSIRGIYVHLASMTVRIDRVGLSYHSSGDAARRFSFKVEGLHVEIHELKTSPQPQQSTSRRLSRILSLANFAPSPIPSRLWSMYSAVYVLLEPYVRPAIRSFFVASARAVIRCLPVLTQVVDFELDRALFTFTTSPEAHVAIRGVTLTATVVFSNLESVVGSASEPDQICRHQRFLSMSHLQSRVSRSAKRVLGRAWGSTRGSASIALKVQKVSGFANAEKWPQLNPDAVSSSKHAVASEFAFVTHSSHSRDMCFDLQDSAELVASFKFGPTKRIIQDHSISASFRMPSIQFSTGPLQMFHRAIKDLRARPNSHGCVNVNATRRYKTAPRFQGRGLTNRGSKHSFSKVTLFRSVDLSIKDISVRHAIWGKDELRPRYFTGHTRSLSVSFELGEPERNILHKDFLGNCPDRDPNLDTEIISFSFTAKDMTVFRRGAAESLPPSRVISISSASLQGFATQLMLLNMPTTSVFPGDPNAAFLVIKLSVSAPQLSERVDIVVDVLEHIQRSRRAESTPREPLRILRSVPRIRVDIAVDDVAACLIPLERDGISSSSLILSSTQCVISLSTYFKYFPLAKTSLQELEDTNFIPLEMEIAVQSLLGPAFVMVLPKPFTLDTSSNEAPGNRDGFRFGGDPLLSLSAFEFVASGQTLGGLVDGTDEVILDMDSTMVDIRCITDAASIELWQPSAIGSLKSLFESGRDLTKHQAIRQTGFLERLPNSIAAHLAFGQIGVILTGKDINPDEDLDLSRGLAMKSGLALQYCSLHDRRKYARMPKRFTHAHDRQRLNLAEDLIIDANSVASSATGEGRRFALFRCMLWDVTVRTSIATEFAADQAYEATDELNELKSTEFLWVKRVEINAIARHQDAEEGCENASEHLQLSVNVPEVRSRIQLFEVYCAFLALTTMRSLVSSHGSTQRRKDSGVPFALTVTVSTLQLLVRLPLHEQLCLRINGLRMCGSGLHDLSTELGLLFVWVPSIQEELKWEELIRLRSWKVECNKSEPQEVSFTVQGKGARLRIPYGYIMADLILDLNFFLKCIKHLNRVVSVGDFWPMSHPTSEGAKSIPKVEVKIGCISLEASDDSLESKLSLIWRAGFEAARARLEREEAFQEKVAAIQAAEGERMDSPNYDSRFTRQHTVSIEEARERLLLVHSLSWTSLHREYRDEQKRRELNVRKEIRGEHYHFTGNDADPLVPLVSSSKAPPLLRFIASHVTLEISRPQFPTGDVHDFLHDLGKGLPGDTQFTLLVPLHLHMTLGSSCVTLRDYPLPLLNIVQESPAKAVAWVVDMDLVVAEELGTPTSVIWKDCPVVPAGSGSAGTKPLHLSIPKTTMPVKTYANPVVNVLTRQLTEFCWGVSYASALQDVMRIIDTFTTPPPDPSPAIGFWDKIRLSLHWRSEFNFASDVHLNLKGSRDPHATEGAGAGFALCWNGNTKMSVGQANSDNELLQVYSDTMLIVIPDFVKRAAGEVTGEGISSRFARGPVSLNQGLEGRRKHFKKICAKFSSGIKWGIGIVLERTCGESCPKCDGTFACRLFDFRPHHEIKLQPKSMVPIENTPEDSFNGFRSDYIHFSTSLSSRKRSSTKRDSSSFHLTPKTFAHFWSWWGLFDRSLSLPVRQGNLFPNVRPSSKKFGRHLATIKYRLAIQRLFISHIYLSDTQESWSNGITHCVGVKALVNTFEADMHQREQEGIVLSVVPNKTKKIRHKPFYAAEVKLIDAQLRAVLATFVDPTKCQIETQESGKDGKFKDIRSDETTEALRGFWFDLDDFVEMDWQPTDDSPPVHMIPVASCPRFTYFKRSSNQSHNDAHHRATESSRFGNEDTHVCLLGKEPPVKVLQSEIVTKRLSELQNHLETLRHSSVGSQCEDDNSEAHAVEKKIRQLARHLAQLQASDASASSRPDKTGTEFANYLMPSDITFPVDWTEFDNAYQAHCPKFSLNNSTRDILIEYYYCSRARRGIEYHMATRAVKFIRDQVEAYSRVSSDSDNMRSIRNPTGLAAQLAAQALKKILIGDGNGSADVHSSQDAGSSGHAYFNPMSGWSNDTVTQNKSHFCLLLKPQIVLRSEAAKDSILVLAALQGTLQSHNILDTANIDDPISGRVMTRTHAVLTGLQTFSPSSTCSYRHDGVPLEVLIDLRAESGDFDRLVPQTDATFLYDKFNRLRLRNNVTSAVPNSSDESNSHLQHQSDLVDICVPYFTVSANSKNFESIANIITTLLLRSDAAHKMRLSKVETLLFSYDFTDLLAAADVVVDYQSRLRRAFEHERNLEAILESDDEQGRMELMKMKAHTFLLSEELNLIFDAIKLAQEKTDDKHADAKMALKLHASSREISWGMIDDASEMIAKLAVRGIDFSWLSRQDGSTVNNLEIVDLQVFDGSPDAEWPEILFKHREPANHPLVKRGIFAQADWTVLAPVGGITIYERFILELHPMRLQLESRVGKSIMEYVWPARRDRKRLGHSPQSSGDYDTGSNALIPDHSAPVTEGRASLDSPATLHERKRFSNEERRPTSGLTSRRIPSSRSFTDLRRISRQNSMRPGTPGPSSFLAANKTALEFMSFDGDPRKTLSTPVDLPAQEAIRDDAAEMKTRSAQKTFVLVRISSMHILLSFHKDGSFFCRDARIHTRELQYRNQTWSFEELADQFIPTDTSWRGWMRMALHQPLVPVIPVARELFSKTKWITSKGKARKGIKPSTTDSPRTSEQSRRSGSHIGLPESPKSRKLRRHKRSTETTDRDDREISLH